MLSNRISHWFDLSGPSITLDTACSASTAALHMACDSLRTGSSKIALVSGANLMLEPNLMMALSSLKFVQSTINKGLFLANESVAFLAQTAGRICSIKELTGMLVVRVSVL